MNLEQSQWVTLTSLEASAGAHIFPQMAACEAALESAYGESTLARIGNNLFGLKQHQHPVYGVIALPTKEFLDGEWQVVEADFISYPTLADCFADRMATLRRLEDVYPHYAEALAAPDAETYVTEVSRTWSTDPDRAKKCISLYREFFPPQTSPLTT